MGSHGEDVVMSQYAKDELPATFECKSLAKIAVYNYYEQCKQHGDGEPIVIIKQNNSKYNIFLYSNTNQIHHDYFIAEFENKVANYPFVSLFKKPYYSHEMGMRKPDPASFSYILEKEGLVASETLFIDDNEPNILAAASVGLQVLHLKEGMTVEKDIAAYL